MPKRGREDEVVQASPPTSTPDDDAPADEPQPLPEEAPKSKYAGLDSTATPGMNTDSQRSRIFCELPPHFRQIRFDSVAEYEQHFSQYHTNRCKECLVNLPTEHLLHLHLAEKHDAFTAAKQARGDRTFACFVETCTTVCKSTKNRRNHLVNVHGFPVNYDFFVVNDGIDGKTSLLRPMEVYEAQKAKSIAKNAAKEQSCEKKTAKSHENETNMDTDDRVEGKNPLGGAAKENETCMETDGPVEQEDQARQQASEEVSSDGPDASSGSPDVDDAVMTPETGTSRDADGVDDLTKSFRSMKMVPRTVRFGRRQGWRSGFAKS